MHDAIEIRFIQLDVPRTQVIIIYGSTYYDNQPDAP